MTRRRNRAFTLLEVILAITLIVGLLGAAFGFYHRAAEIRQRVGDEVEQVRTLRVVMDRLTTELRSAMVARREIQGMLVMNSEEIEFTTVAMPGLSSWTITNDDADPPSPEYDVRLVGYAIGQGTDADGEPVLLGLVRRCWKVPMIQLDPGEDAEDLTEDILAPSIRFLRFRYYAGLALTGDDGEAAGGITDDGWVEQWSRMELPLAVEITLGAEPLEEGVEPDEYIETHETFRRVVALPTATAAQTGGRP